MPNVLAFCDVPKQNNPMLCTEKHVQGAQKNASHFPRDLFYLSPVSMISVLCDVFVHSKS